MSFYNTISELENIKLNLTNHFDINQNSDWQDNVLKLNNVVAKGEIEIVPVSETVFFIDFDLVCFENVKFKMFGGSYKVINFLYCLEGQLNQQFVIDNSFNKISKYQSAIVKTEIEEGLVLNFKKNKPVKASNISVFKEKTSRAEDEYIEALFSIFTKNNVVHLNSYNLKIAEHLDSFHSIEGIGIIKKLQVDAVIMMILANMIEEHKLSLKNKIAQQSHLTIREISIVRELTEEINSKPEKPYNINQLMAETGLSAAKLQEGFKLISGYTITEYIRNVRLEKAEELIRTKDLTISEVVYTIGFSSRSYFSKIFKEKYECSPKYYQEHAGQPLGISA